MYFLSKIQPAIPTHAAKLLHFFLSVLKQFRLYNINMGVCCYMKLA